MQIQKVKNLHDNDLREGFGEVWLPDALETKYPNAPKEIQWQYLFPSGKRSIDPRSGKERRHHIREVTVQRSVKLATKTINLINVLPVIHFAIALLRISLKMDRI
jgi:hypothetical protein